MYKILTTVSILSILITTPLIAQEVAPDTIKGHIQSMMEAGERMMSQGEQGHRDVMVRHAEAMREHARAVLEAISSNDRQSRKLSERLKETIGHLDELIARGAKSHGDILMAHAKKAMSHAREAAKHSD